MSFLGGADKYNCPKKKTEPKPTGPLSHLPDDPGSVGGWLMVGEEHTHLQNLQNLPKSGRHRYRHLLTFNIIILTHMVLLQSKWELGKEGIKVKGALS